MDRTAPVLVVFACCLVALLAGCVEASPRQPLPTPGKVAWACDFEGSYCGMVEQSKVEPDRRSTFVPVARHGRQGIKLTTLPGDDQVHGSGPWERNDLELPPSPEYCHEGQEEWWSVSVLFPDDFVPAEDGTEIMDFHGDSSHGQANMNLLARGSELRLHGFYGDVDHPGEYKVDMGRIRRNVWYDLVYHVKWASGSRGFMTVWVNGRKMLSHRGPTLYPGIPCYLKLANYHGATGKPSSIIFDRVIRGTGAGAVAVAQLER